jgi:Sulfotransferase domain
VRDVKPLIDPTTLPPLLKCLLKVPRAITASVRLLPDFIIIGAMRCGTSSLYRYLIEHPCIAPALRKEVHFFDRNFFRNGTNWYRQHFPSSLYKYYVRTLLRRDFITGEGSPYYVFHPHAAKRVFQTVPRGKLIVLLRNPVDRAYSHYHYEVKRGRETFSFEEAIEWEPKRLAGERERMLADQRYESLNCRYYSYVFRGLYADQLKNWLGLFPKEQFLFVRSEDFFASPSAILAETLQFLGLPAWEPSEFPKYNYAGYSRLTAAKYNYAPYPKMNAETRARLLEYFRPHNQRLYELLDRDFEWEK